MMLKQVSTCCQNNAQQSQHQAYNTPGYLLGLRLPRFGDLLLLPPLPALLLLLPLPLRRPTGDAEPDLPVFGLLL
jgi:hypothetical protein